MDSKLEKARTLEAHENTARNVARLAGEVRQTRVRLGKLAALVKDYAARLETLEEMLTAALVHLEALKSAQTGKGSKDGRQPQ
jgi:hypothetical protein